jgi:hypothetical protein
VKKHLIKVFRSWFSKRPPALGGTPAIRRLKTYSSQTGYVYRYYYEGHRAYAAGGEEFVFTVSNSAAGWYPVSVMVSTASVGAWEASHGRTLSATERYAVAKLALFQAFDERPPDRMRTPVEVRPADVEGIIETLGL